MEFYAAERKKGGTICFFFFPHFNLKCSLRFLLNEWIKKLWYIYTMEFYAAERKKELIPCLLYTSDAADDPEIV